VPAVQHAARFECRLGSGEGGGVMARLDDLEELRRLLWESIGETPPDKRAPLAAQLRGVLAEITELGGDAAPVERNGLVDFQQALAQRQQSKASGSRSASR